MISPVRIEQVAPRLFAAARGHAKAGQVPAVMMPLLDAAWKFIRASGVKSDGHNIAVYYCTADGLDIEAGASVLGDFTESGSISCRATPGGTAAAVTLMGDYSGIREANRIIGAWAKANQRELAGPSWEIYGHWTEDPSQLQTDIYYLLK